MLKWRTFYLLILLAVLPTLANADSAVMDGLFKFHKDLASQGDPQSMYILGNMYANGKGVTRNYDAALHWYERSVENGNSRALARIAEVVIKKQAAEKRQIRQKNVSTRKHIQENKASKKQGEIKDKANPLALQQKLRDESLEEMWFEAEEKRPDNSMIAPSNIVSPSETATPLNLKDTAVEINANLNRVNETLQQGVETNQQTPPVVLTEDPNTDPVKKETGFKANPCSGPAAQFMSTCN
ncbi:MAG: SEL1-like repeat protein [Gammaproteobacteria bacterium]|nr:SEL1-like repeat protein [Gammaproteobacteria bacterium]